MNGKFYYGIHTGPVVETPGRLYLGSGTVLKAAIKKYGKHNFSREIVEIFNDYESAYAREAEIVNESLVADPMCYNVRVGGRGGWAMPQSAKDAIAAWQIGRKWPMRGKKAGDTMRGVPKSDAHREALRKPKSLTLKMCPHCGVQGGGPNMTRYHFDNCRGPGKNTLKRWKSEAKKIGN